MSPESKQRIIGVIVLIAFIALLIPFLFTSGVKKRHPLAGEETPTNAAPMAGQNLDINAQENNLQIPVKTQQAVVPPVTDDVNQQAIPVKQPMAPMQTDILPQTEGQPNATPQNNLNSSVESELEKHPALSQSETVAIPEANAQVVVDSTSSVEPIKPQIIKTKKSTTISSSSVKNKVKMAPKQMIWSVQVGSFADQSRMQKLVEKVQASGYRVYLQKINTSHGLMTRVLVGRETNKNQAIQIAHKLKTDLKIDGRIVGRKK